MPLIEFDSSLTTPPMFSVSPFSLSHLQSLICSGRAYIAHPCRAVLAKANTIKLQGSNRKEHRVHKIRAGLGPTVV